MPTRYIVHGTDSAQRPVQKILEAESAAHAEQQATRLGVRVTGVEVDPTCPSLDATPAPVVEGPRGTRSLGPEHTVWSGTPSQWVNFWWFVSCILIIPIPVAIWKWLEVKFERMTLTTQRLRIEEGVLTKRVDEIELYRIKDTQLKQSVIDRVLGLGTVEVVSSDETNPVLHIKSIRDAKNMREQLRQCVEKLRLARGVREVDFATMQTGDLP